MDFKLNLLKQTLGPQLIEANQLRSPEGLPTGLDALDQFLLWQGLPKGDVCLFTGSLGCGATRLWLQTAQLLQQQGQWAAWLNSDLQLCPWSQTASRLNFKKLLVVDARKNIENLFWLLQEMLSSGLFTLIGCQRWPQYLKRHQLLKLKKLARLHQVTLVFFETSSIKTEPYHHQDWSCVIDFQRDFITVSKAAHRPTPFILSGSVFHENFMPQFTTQRRSLVC